MMIEIGIPKIDDFLKGGLPLGKSLLYYIHPGVEGDIFGMQTLYTNLQKGYKCVCITATASPDTLRERYREYDFNLEKYDDNFDIIDAYSALIGADSSEKYIVKNPEDIKNIDKVINEAIEDSRGGLIVHGSLSNIMDMCGEEETLQYIDGWNKNMLLYDSVGIYNFTAWPYSDDTIKKVRDEFFNAVVKVGGIAEKVIFGQYYSVSKSDWINGNLGHSILFKILKPGGVRAYLPKILVTGPFNAGKSTFIQSLSTRSVSVDRFGTTVALDHGHVEHNGFSADIFGTPGQERFDPILKTLGGEAMGVFLVIDSTKPEECERAKQMLEITQTFGLPSVIVANKQDGDGALSIGELKEEMSILDEQIPIIPVVAKDGNGVIEAFEMLIDRIMVRL
ncbi:MAG: ATPase domain-containing protein [Halobacteriota archaeon]|nr:ATPase domain-containing protein [Halobacteriota archaeon]